MSIYTTFTPDDIVEANPTVVTTGLWSGDSGSWETDLYIDTDDGRQVDVSGEYYLDVYDKNPATDSLAEVQFSIAYGHINGGGAPTLDIFDQATRPTEAIYSQYRNLLLDPSDTRFTFNGVESDHIYVINFQRSRIREQLDPGNWELPLSGYKGISTFIDDSNQTLGALTANSKAGRVFNVVSGSLSVVSGSVFVSSSYSSSAGYGLAYPDLGIIVLNPDAIVPTLGWLPGPTGSLNTLIGYATAAGYFTNQSPWPLTAINASSALYDGTLLENSDIMFAPITQSLTDGQWGTSKAAYNHHALFVSIKGGAINSPANVGFRARSAETISSTHYFVRLRNKEYNYSNNPTFYNPDNGALIIPDFRNNPKVYVTTVGLYNDQNELLAVAKLSKPVRKSFDEEVLLRVRLDF